VFCVRELCRSSCSLYKVEVVFSLFLCFLSFCCRLVLLCERDRSFVCELLVILSVREIFLFCRFLVSPLGERDLLLCVEHLAVGRRPTAKCLVCKQLFPYQQTKILTHVQHPFYQYNIDRPIPKRCI
jgi:hypothetical protein